MRWVLILSIFLSGCVKYVDVPVWVCPSPNIPIKEELKSKSITDSSTTDDILRSLLYDVVYQETYIRQLTTILDGYKTNTVPILDNRLVQGGK